MPHIDGDEQRAARELRAKVRAKLDAMSDAQLTAAREGAREVLKASQDGVSVITPHSRRTAFMVFELGAVVAAERKEAKHG